MSTADTSNTSPATRRFRDWLPSRGDGIVMRSKTHPIAWVGGSPLAGIFGLILDLIVAYSIYRLMTGLTFGPQFPFTNPSDPKQVIHIPLECFIIPWAAILHYWLTALVSRVRPRRSGLFAFFDFIGTLAILTVAIVAAATLLWPPAYEFVVVKQGWPKLAFNLTTIVTLAFFVPLSIIHLIQQIYRAWRGYEGTYGYKGEVRAEVDQAFGEKVPEELLPRVPINLAFRTTSSTGEVFDWPFSHKLQDAFVRAARAGLFLPKGDSLEAPAIDGEAHEVREDGVHSQPPASGG